jgi:hypothetical protein
VPKNNRKKKKPENQPQTTISSKSKSQIQIGFREFAPRFLLLPNNSRPEPKNHTLSKENYGLTTNSSKITNASPIGIPSRLESSNAEISGSCDKMESLVYALCVGYITDA